jgi:hypothetical protein
VRGGDGRDTIRGNDGNDILEGNKGPDVILGLAGDDRIDGGPNTDECRQGPGSGRIRNCETADLRVRVLGPTFTNLEPEEVATFRIRVVNDGPDATGYELTLSVTDDGTCTGQEIWDGTSQEGLLKPGKTRVRQVEMRCGTSLNESTIHARVDPDARDPKPANNEASLTTIWD